MKLKFFTTFCMVLGFFGKVYMDNNSENSSSFGSSNSTMVLNNMLAREILKRQALENKVTTLERQIQSLVTDVAATKSTYMALQHATEGISLRQNNMAVSLQTITQRMDSENVNIKQRLGHLSNITNRLQTSGGQAPEDYVAFLARVTTDNPTQQGPTVPFQTTDFNLGNGYSPSSGVFLAPVSGVYNFQLTIHITTGRFDGYLSLNGIPQTYVSASGPETYSSVSVTLRLNKGDQVWVVRSNSMRPTITARKSIFSGFLVHVV